MTNKSILIIGGAGYIGSRLTEVLKNKYIVTSLDCGWSTNANIDINKDYNTLTSEELRNYNIIILLAGHSSVKSCEGPIESPWANNVSNFKALIKKLNKNQLLIYASSASVYGISNSKYAFKECDYEFNPVNNYDITKYVVDLHAKLAIQSNKNIIGLRFGTVNGWAPNLRVDVMINAMVNHARLTNEILLYNKHSSRAILGIEDLCKAILYCINTPITGIYNLASFDSTIEQIAEKVAKKLNVKIKDCGNSNNVYSFNLDTTLFKQTFNFEFKETIDTITDSLVEKTLTSNIGSRNNYIIYDGKY